MPTLPTLDLELLRTFIAVVDHHSFAEAGAQLARTQSSVTQHMQRLEQLVGVSLFEKRGRQNNSPKPACSCCVMHGKCSRSTTRP